MKQGKVVKEPTLAQQAVEVQVAKDDKTTKAMTGTEAGTIWEEIREKSIDMFALPDQKVFMHVHPVNIEPSKLYLLLNSTSVLPSLETAVGKKYNVELVDRFVVVSRAVVAPTK